MSCCPEHKEDNTAHSEYNKHMGHADHKNHSGHGGAEAAGDFLRRFYIVTFLLIPLVLLTETALGFLGIGDFVLRRYLQLGIATAIFYYSLVFFEHAKHEVHAKKYGMMTLVSLAVGAGYLFSAASTFLPQLDVEFYVEISSLIWVLLFGHYLEAKSSSAAGDALQEVAKLLPKQAHLLKDGKTVDVDLAKLKEGDVVLIKPGEKVPADGLILKGKANMNEALISGESKPVEKSKKDKVIAGSICIDGSLEVKLDRVGENSTIGQIQKLIAKAQKTKPTAQKIADKAASILTFSALVVGLIALLFWTLIVGQTLAFALTLAITVLVIACPHALGLAIPTVSTIATTLATKNGVFLKDLGKLEIIKKIDYVVFDKTGTLTKAEFGVTDVLNISRNQSEILKIAASLEEYSSHVIGISIVKYAQEQDVKPERVDRFKNIAGKGIYGLIAKKEYYIGNRALMDDLKIYSKQAEEIYKRLSAQDKTVVFLATKKEIIGTLALADTIKKESYSAVENLHKLGLKVAMLTGDNEKVARSVAKELKIDSYFAEVRPEEKYKHIKELQKDGSKVMMVGDGVNDAPALAQSDVGVAIGAGTDVAVEAGDVVLTRNNPEDIARLTILAGKVYRKMIENLIWATGYNVVAIPAAAGIFAPWGFFLRPDIGALLMAGSSVIVVLNAMLLKRVNLDIRYDNIVS
jgi:P-type Cu2+ transporter